MLYPRLCVWVGATGPNIVVAKTGFCKPYAPTEYFCFQLAKLSSVVKPTGWICIQDGKLNRHHH